jgi:D-glycero-D-manno-heptose 1,7-bisphosphate phosphatase
LTSGARPAVFVDRDGTLIEECGYLSRLDAIHLFPFTVDAVRLLNRAGLAVVVLTNQSGVARGYFDEAFVRETHRVLGARIAAGGGRVDAFYYCPHYPDAKIERYRQACECRKPGPGVLRRAAADLSLDLSRSFAVGDRWSDVEAGRAAGARGVLVRTGFGRMALDGPRPDLDAALVADNLMEATSWILRERARCA